METARNDRLRRRQEVRDLLWIWGGSAARIKELMTELDEARQRVADARVTLHAQVIDDMPKGSSVPRDLADVMVHIERVTAAFAAESARIDHDIDDIMRQRRSVEAALGGLRAVDAQVLRLRYGRRMSWVRIGIEIGRTDSHARRIEARACDRLGKVLGAA